MKVFKQLQKQPSKELYVFITLCFCAGWINLSAFHLNQNSDSIVPVLSSLYHWTYYYWGQNRFGMPIALIASPIHHPLYNLLFQNFITIFFGLSFFFILAKYAFKNQNWIAIGSVSAGLYILFETSIAKFAYLSTEQAYGTALCLGIISLIFLENSRLILASLCLFLSFWINCSLVIILLPLYFFKHRDSLYLKPMLPIQKNRILHLVIIFLIFIIQYLFTKFAAYQDTSYGITHTKEWGRGWTQIGLSVWRQLLTPSWIASLGICATFGFFLKSKVKTSYIFISAIFYYFFLGISLWPKMNDYASRYAIPSLLLLQIIPVAYALGRIKNYYIPLLFLSFSVIFIYSTKTVLPSINQVEFSLNQKIGKFSKDLISTKATHFIGPYDDVWPAMFHVNLKYYQSHSHDFLWGVTYRSSVTSPYWKAHLDQAIFAISYDTSSVEEQTEKHHIPKVIPTLKLSTLQIGQVKNLVTH